MKQLIAEFIGTFFLVLTIALTQNPLAIGVVLMIMVYTLGPISGGHFNPAVTTAVLINKAVTKKQAAQYIIAQFLGSLTAALAFLLIGGSYFMPGIPVEGLFIRAYLIEMIFTFALVFVVLNVAVSKRVTGNQYFGAAIGLTIFVAATAGGTISGGAFNPAVGVAPILLNIGQLASNLPNIALYILGPLAGAIIGALVYRYMEK